MTKRQTGDGGYDDQTVPMTRRAAAQIPVLLRPTHPGHGQAFRLSTGSCLVGTSKGAHLRLDDPTVSRQHCEVELTPEGVVVSDLESRNGTFYLGRRVDRIVLSPGSIFAVGAVTVAIEADVDRDKIEPSAHAHCNGLDGVSSPMRRLFGWVDRLSASLVPVLIVGESGAGKTTLAKAIHASSPAAKGPLVVVPCASLSRDAQAAEIFGSESVLLRAHGGTLLLRDVDALAPDLQPALLEVLETQRLRREGGSTAETSFRFLAATGQMLDELTLQGKFHQGLFYRLALRLEVPPLRARREDIALLATQLQSDAADPLPADVLQQLAERAWPGNVRELRGVVTAYQALGVLPAPSRIRGNVLELALDELVDPTRPYADQKDALVDRFTSRYLKALIDHTDGNQSVAAKLAGLDRTYLGRLMSKHGLKG